VPCLWRNTRQNEGIKEKPVRITGLRGDIRTGTYSEYEAGA